MNQGVRECYIKFKTGQENEPFIATAPQVEYPPSNPEWEAALREMSAQRYNRSLETIEAERRARLERLEAMMRAGNAEPVHTASKRIRPRR